MLKILSFPHLLPCFHSLHRRLLSSLLPFFLSLSWSSSHFHSNHFYFSDIFILKPRQCISFIFTFFFFLLFLQSVYFFFHFIPLVFTFKFLFSFAFIKILFFLPLLFSLHSSRLFMPFLISCVSWFTA